MKEDCLEPMDTPRGPAAGRWEAQIDAMLCAADWSRLVVPEKD